jgi:hypothetical protein
MPTPTPLNKVLLVKKLSRQEIPGISLPCFKEPNTGSYAQLVYSSPGLPILLL